MIKVGLTGGIGAGKSEVARLLAALGAFVIDSDELAREVVAPGTPGLADVVAQFGPEFLRADGSLDRAKLARTVFQDEQRLAALNAIVHPLVGARTAALAASAPEDAVIVYDVPLLVENGLAPQYDVVVVVDAAPETQLRRLVEGRGMTEAEARSRMAVQASREQRRAVADVVLDNDGDLESLEDQVRRLWWSLTVT